MNCKYKLLLSLPFFIVAMGCPVIAKISVIPRSSGESNRVPIGTTGIIENQAENGERINSVPFIIDEAGVKKSIDFEVRKGSTLLTTITYPGGAKDRQTERVPTDPKDNIWHHQIIVQPVDLADQKAGIDFFKESAENLSLVERVGEPLTSIPPSTTYDQVVKFVGALVIMPPDWTPDQGFFNKYISIISVDEPQLAPTSGAEIHKKLVIESNAEAKAKLNVAVFGSLGASISDNSIYKMSFDLKHTPILGLDSNIFSLLATSKSQRVVTALATLKYLAKTNPNYKIYVLKSMRYIVSGTIGVTQGKRFSSFVDAAVSSVFTASAAYSFNLNDELYIPLSGVVTAWAWSLHPQSLKDVLEYLEDLRAAAVGYTSGATSNGANSTAAVVNVSKLTNVPIVKTFTWR